MKNRWVRMIVFVFVLGAAALLISQQKVQAQEKEEGWLQFRMGGNSQIESSVLKRKFSMGLSAGIHLPKTPRQLHFEPGLGWNWPKTEYLDAGGYPLGVSVKTIVIDFNGALVVPCRYPKLNPYFSGGIGVLRNSWSIPEFGVGTSEKYFTRNIGFGARWLMGEEQGYFVGGEYRKYWSSGGNFYTVAGTIGLRF